jgi:hypothetical protein
MNITPDQKNAEVLRRIGEYDNIDHKANVEKLIAYWRNAHPEAAKEVSAHLHPLIPIEGRSQPDWTDWRDTKGTKEYDELWVNDVYQVTVRYWTHEQVFRSDPGRMIQLGISAHGGTAKHDFRDMMAMKNQLAGPECEAFELYPAESRLLDPSNHYILACFPDVKHLRFGSFTGRDVRPASEALAPQRDFPKEDKA